MDSAATDWSYFDSDVKAKTAQMDRTYGVLYRKRPANADDLLLVNGIGKAVRDKLWDMGVFHFSQVLRWTPKISAAVEKRLKLRPDQVSKEKWVAQCKRLEDLKAKGQKLTELTLEELETFND
jgi:predicted flap endonuclease-1-like 5' DNA nuclease